MNSKLNSTLYFPDISGFTNFVNNTEIEHGQQITASLLEEIINSNYVDFIVSEIEGDSVLFFKAESKEEVNKLIELSLHIHKKFHQRRNQLNESANCSCGACSSIVNLKLKFIIHIGEVKKIKIHTYEKLYGRDVIIAHRLLKNNIPYDEYILFTNSTVDNYSDFTTHPELGEGKIFIQNIDNLGLIQGLYFIIPNLDKTSLHIHPHNH